jgi:hypothetical protein
MKENYAATKDRIAKLGVMHIKKYTVVNNKKMGRFEYSHVTGMNMLYENLRSMSSFEHLMYSTFNNNGRNCFMGLCQNPIDPYIILKLRT